MWAIAASQHNDGRLNQLDPAALRCLVPICTRVANLGHLLRRIPGGGRWADCLQVDIPPLTELSYEYGYVAGSVPGCFMACYCGANSCRRRLL